MNSSQLRVVGAGVAFLVMFLSGFWLNRTGKPYGTLIFTIHKITGLGLGIFLYLSIRQIHQVAALSPVEIAIIVVTALFFVATVITGSLLSIPVSRPMPDVVSRLNKVLPYFTLLSTTLTLYILLNRR